MSNQNFKPKTIHIDNGHYEEKKWYYYRKNNLKRIFHKEYFHGDNWTDFFYYDTNNRLERVKHSYGTTEFEYNSSGLLIKETESVDYSKRRNNNTYTVINTFTYDSNNRLLTRKEVSTEYGTPRERNFEYKYSGSGVLQTITSIENNWISTFEFSSYEHPLKNINIPPCYLTDYMQVNKEVLKITNNQTSGLVSNDIKTSNQNFPTKVEQEDINGFDWEINIQYK